MQRQLRRNPGLVVGVVVDRTSGNRVSGAQVRLSRLDGGGGARRITLYGEDELQARSIMDRTDENGRFSLVFTWDPLDLGAVIAHRPNCHLTVQRTFLASDTPHGITRHETRLGLVLNLRAIANGSLPNPREPGDFVGMAIGLAADMRGVRLPSAFVTVRDPSASYYALLGLTQIRAQ